MIAVFLSSMVIHAFESIQLNSIGCVTTECHSGETRSVWISLWCPLKMQANLSVLKMILRSITRLWQLITLCPPFCSTQTIIMTILHVQSYFLYLFLRSALGSQTMRARKHNQTTANRKNEAKFPRPFSVILEFIKMSLDRQKVIQKLVHDVVPILRATNDTCRTTDSSEWAVAICYEGPCEVGFDNCLHQFCRSCIGNLSQVGELNCSELLGFDMPRVYLLIFCDNRKGSEHNVSVFT